MCWPAAWLSCSKVNSKAQNGKASLGNVVGVHPDPWMMKPRGGGTVESDGQELVGLSDH